MPSRRSRVPVYVFVLWSEARSEQQRILDDLAARFTVLDRVEVTWTPDETFARSLTRMYGDALPPGSDKELHYGTGPFLVVVVQDRRPRLRPRRTGRGRRLLNSNVYDARRRYRGWTGGGYRVHASDSVVETERNLVLLFGEGIAAFAARGPARGSSVRRHVGDPVGTWGWDSTGQLLRALAPYGAHATGRQQGSSLTVAARDTWWAEHIAGGRQIRPGAREVSVGGRQLELTIRQQPVLPVRALAGVARRLPWRRRNEVPSWRGDGSP